MKGTIEPGLYKAPNPGLYCPVCHSNNTGFLLSSGWNCFDCGENFHPNNAWRLETYEPKEAGKTDFGVFYERQEGSTYFLTNEEIKEYEEAKVKRRKTEEDWKREEPERQKQNQTSKLLSDLSKMSTKDLMELLNNSHMNS